jgi:hypothetical protein
MFTTNWGLFGGESCRPVAGDYDGDGRTDLAVYRRTNAFWFILQSSDCQPVVVQWGWAGTLPAPGDYDGDNRTDLAVYDPAGGNWWITPSASHRPYVINWGFAGCAPVPGDYDGDARPTWLYITRRRRVVYVSKFKRQMRQASGIRRPVRGAGDYRWDATDLCVYYPYYCCVVQSCPSSKARCNQHHGAGAAPRAHAVAARRLSAVRANLNRPSRRSTNSADNRARTNPGPARWSAVTNPGRSGTSPAIAQAHRVYDRGFRTRISPSAAPPHVAAVTGPVISSRPHGAGEATELMPNRQSNANV